MIHLPIVDHARRLVASACIFGTAVLLMLWLPVRLLRAVWPAFLPYTVALHSEAHVNELSLELLLLQVSWSHDSEILVIQSMSRYKRNINLYNYKTVTVYVCTNYETVLSYGCVLR